MSKFKDYLIPFCHRRGVCIAYIIAFLLGTLEHVDCGSEYNL